MRMRYKPYARPELAAWPRHVDDPAAQRGRWPQVFGDPRLPLHLELGCGKGRFLALSALNHPERNYLGIDIKSEMLVVAKRTAERLFSEAGRPITNLATANFEIELLHRALCFEDGVQRVYINFCNPWSKAGHAKHRLTHPRQLATLRTLLPAGGEICFKTDDGPLFAASLRYFAAAGFHVVWQSADLHADEPPWNIRTEHEEMFAAGGIPIKACIARMADTDIDLDVLRLARQI